VQSGNRDAQKALYETSKVYLLGVASLYASSKQEAEDILLEGFYRIFKDIKSYEALLNIPDNIDFSASERANSILAIIRTLKEPERTIFSLKGIEGYSYKEIAEKLELNESTLRSHYLRAKKKLQIILRKELEEDGSSR